MQANPQFQHLPTAFWAYLRAISQALGYTQAGQVKIYSVNDVEQAFQVLSTRLGEDLTGVMPHFEWIKQLANYSVYRAFLLNEIIQPYLMTAERAKQTYEAVKARLPSPIPIPMNKQSGEKKQPAYFTALVQCLIAEALAGRPCDFNPQLLPMFTKNQQLIMTQSRRMDGCFPSCLNPLAVWEIKEYYYTTSFGSRIADGVYETLLDGFELNALPNDGQPPVYHLLMVDAYETWWLKGKSYLCRLIDMLHMGYVDEVLFGAEVVERLPLVVVDWVTRYEQCGG